VPASRVPRRRGIWEVLRRAAGFPGALSGAHAAACEGRAGAEAV